MEEKRICPHCLSELAPGEACGCPGSVQELEKLQFREKAIAASTADEVRIQLVKLPGDRQYHRQIEASSVKAAYNALAVLIKEVAELSEQPIDHAVAVLATILLTTEPEE